MTTTLITGANKGLGFETARRLVAADLGSGPPHAAALRTHRTTGITANEVHLARHVHLVLQGGLLEREEAMALLAPVPLRSALLAGG